ncbi:MAG: hypothetical protein IBX72_14130 [Nitrospirae bacterium]|nr:hypothetical protein [Nitrospirota bacterium]
MSKATRYRIDFHLAFPFVILDIRSAFDALLAWARVRELKLDGIIDEDVFRREIDNLPIRKVPFGEKYFYAASGPIFTRLSLGTFNFTRKNDLMRYRQLGYGKEDILAIANTLEQSSGPYKTYMGDLSLTHTYTVSYVVDVTDYKVFEKLLYNIRYIGKKRNLGFGKVKYIEKKTTDEPIVRTVPVESGLKYEDPIFSMPIKPPYWEGEKYLCGMGKL